MWATVLRSFDCNDNLLHKYVHSSCTTSGSLVELLRFVKLLRCLLQGHVRGPFGTQIFCKDEYWVNDSYDTT